MQEMLGINVSALEKIINTNDFNSDLFNNNLDELYEIISGLKNCCVGNDLKFLISEQNNQIPNIEYIGKIIKNYSTILQEVKKAYFSQDAVINQNFSNVNL